MSNKLLILTSGASQLITQLSVLHNFKFKLDKVFVYYIGIDSYNTSLLISKLCKIFDITFCGTHNKAYYIKPLKANGKNYLLSFYYYFKRITHQRKKDIFVKKYSKSIVIINIRPKVESDLFLIALLRPRRIYYTIDGVINSGFQRNYPFIKWPFFNVAGSKMPGNFKIFTPDFLVKETQKLGRPVVLDNHTYNTVKDKIRNYFFLQKHMTLNHISKGSAIIFSQHLALSNVCSLKEEIKFYGNLISHILKNNGINHIFFKPHPRDKEEKLEAMQDLYRMDDRVTIISSFEGNIPIEIYTDKIINNNCLLATVNSTAVILPKYMGCESILCATSNFFVSDFKKEVNVFASSNSIPLVHI